MSDLGDLRESMRAFTDERDWHRFHDPKSLLIAITGELGELAELLQWIPADEQMETCLKEPLHTRIGEEMSDVLLYLVRLADVLGIDLGEAAERKMRMNAEKHRP